MPAQSAQQSDTNRSARERLEDDLQTLGMKVHALDNEDRALNQEIAKVRKRYGKQIRRRTREIMRLAREIGSLARVHRLDLTDEGRTKTIELLPGFIQWYIRQDPLTMSEDLEVIIERIKEAGAAQQFIRSRVIEELKEDELRAHPRLAARFGIKVSKSERFAIVPKEGKKRLVRRAGQRSFAIQSKRGQSA